MSGYDHIADVYDVFVQTEADVPFFLTEVGKTSGEILELMGLDNLGDQDFSAVVEVLRKG
jgi:hypothetical protein